MLLTINDNDPFEAEDEDGNEWELSIEWDDDDQSSIVWKRKFIESEDMLYVS